MWDIDSISFVMVALIVASLVFSLSLSTCECGKGTASWKNDTVKEKRIDKFKRGN